MFENYPEIVTSKDLTVMLNLSYSTIRTKIIKESMIPFRRIGSTYRFKREDIIAFVNNTEKEEDK